MGVDVSKIRPGDKVTVEFTVHSTEKVQRNSHPNKGWELGLCVIEECGVSSFCVGANAVRSHTPAPREIKVGDEIPGSTLGALGKSYKVLGVESGWVWFGGKHVVELSAIRSMQAAGL